jgi:hypothetical protein
MSNHRSYDKSTSLDTVDHVVPADGLCRIGTPWSRQTTKRELGAAAGGETSDNQHRERRLLAPESQASRLKWRSYDPGTGLATNLG